MSNEQILSAIILYPFICLSIFLLLMLLEDSYSDKMLINDIKAKSPYPIVRWYLYLVVSLFIPIIFIIEVLKVGFTKDKK